MSSQGLCFFSFLKWGSGVCLALQPACVKQKRHSSRLNFLHSLQTNMAASVGFTTLRLLGSRIWYQQQAPFRIHQILQLTPLFIGTAIAQREYTLQGNVQLIRNRLTPLEKMFASDRLTEIIPRYIQVFACCLLIVLPDQIWYVLGNTPNNQDCSQDLHMYVRLLGLIHITKMQG